MRLIDADKLKKYMHFDDWNTPDERWMPEREVWSLIDAQPTVEAIPMEFIQRQIEEAEKLEDWELNNLGEIENSYSLAYEALIREWERINNETGNSNRTDQRSDQD